MLSFGLTSLHSNGFQLNSSFEMLNLHLGLALRNRNQSAQNKPLVEDVLISGYIRLFSLFLSLLNEVALRIFWAGLFDSIVLQEELWEVS
mgnify:FL=1